MATADMTKSLAGRKAADVPFPLAVLKAMGSLKITVAMFAMAMFIVLVGTLAQDDLDLAQVKRQYFTCWTAYVPFDVFAPTTIFEHPEPYLGGAGFYFPGGATIGLILLINLIAAKTTRFSVQGKGAKLWLGWLITLFGVGLIAAVIMSGHIANGLQGQPPIEYDTLWSLLKGGFVVITVSLMVYAGYLIANKKPKFVTAFVTAAAIATSLVSVLLFTGGDSVRLDNPGLRIVWQLLQATLASSVLLVGMVLVFGRRGGNVLIHAGVGLLMVGQFVFGDRQVEQRIGLAEGEKTNLVVIEDEIEIALVDVSDPKEDIVYAIHEPLIRRYEGSDQAIDDDSLPCKVRILDWMQNSRIENLKEGDENPATAGLGLLKKAVELQPIGAAEAMEDRNIGAAYVELISRKTDKPIATLLLSQERNDVSKVYTTILDDELESVDIDGAEFKVALRFRQLRKPYDVYLKDVERITYSGVETPRDFSSRIVITSRETGASQEGKTWMNNPIRYQGETFYQSRYNKLPSDGGMVETTGLQVVKNAGWVVPYISCMMVFVGMFAHFGGTFSRFASRHSRGAIPGAELQAAAGGNVFLRVLIAAVALGICALVTLGFAKQPSFSRDEVNALALGGLPVQHEGRIKPFDTVAKNILQVTAKPMFGVTPKIEDSNGKKRSASEWLLGVMAGTPWVADAKVFRLYSKDVRDLFDLKSRKGYRYSYAELQPGMERFREEVGKIRELDPDSFTLYQEQVAAASRQINTYELIAFAYRMPPIPDPEQVTEPREYFAQLIEAGRWEERLMNGGAPAIVPPEGEATEKGLIDARWHAFGPSAYGTIASRGGYAELLDQQTGIEIAPASKHIATVSELLTAAEEDDAQKINEKVEEYAEAISEMPLVKPYNSRTSWEQWLGRYSPTLQGVGLYVVAILIGFASFLVKIAGGFDGLRKFSFWLLVGIFVIHTVAIVARVYVSGKAPVINLYSSAVFIGWACVLFALVLEWMFPIGLANLAAGLIGASTLAVARFLDTEDTLHVLQAVLDTQFWLSTHVLTVTAGYSVTFLAGIIGAVALVHRMVAGLDSYPKGKMPKTHHDVQDILYRMAYGIVCFGIFFSFIGTVLGGLWADDSWGRFWGWDPKENGALLIVLWNALVLHAKWDKQVGMRGFAILAVVGNIVTAWSWFGTNQLGIGLHSYGFTNGALIALTVFFIVHVLFIISALVITQAFAAGARRAAGQ